MSTVLTLSSARCILIYSGIRKCLGRISRRRPCQPNILHIRFQITTLRRRHLRSMLPSIFKPRFSRFRTRISRKRLNSSWRSSRTSTTTRILKTLICDARWVPLIPLTRGVALTTFYYGGQVCQIGLKGEQGAREHAIKTGRRYSLTLENDSHWC